MSAASRHRRDVELDLGASQGSLDKGLSGVRLCVVEKYRIRAQPGRQPARAIRQVSGDINAAGFG